MFFPVHRVLYSFCSIVQPFLSIIPLFKVVNILFILKPLSNKLNFPPIYQTLWCPTKEFITRFHKTGQKFYGFQSFCIKTMIMQEKPLMGTGNEILWFPPKGMFEVIEHFRLNLGMGNCSYKEIYNGLVISEIGPFRHCGISFTHLQKQNKKKGRRGWKRKTLIVTSVTFQLCHTSTFKSLRALSR